MLRMEIQWIGIPPIIQIKYGDLIWKTIQNGKLTPVSKMKSVASSVMLNPQPLPPGPEATESSVMLNPQPLPPGAFADWWWKYGGIRVPHLHYAGDAYLLDEKQWQTFSSTVMEDITRKLSAARSISFDQFVNVAGPASEIV